MSQIYAFIDVYIIILLHLSKSMMLCTSLNNVRYFIVSIGISMGTKGENNRYLQKLYVRIDMIS